MTELNMDFPGSDSVDRVCFSITFLFLIKLKAAPLFKKCSLLGYFTKKKKYMIYNFINYIKVMIIKVNIIYNFLILKITF